MTELRVGLIGCGAQGRYLADALSVAGVGRITACADPNPAALRQAVTQTGCTATYPGYAELLADAEVDAVIVATVHDQLQPAALAAVTAGRHAFVEKPLALTAADARVVVAAAARAGATLMVNYTLRFMPARLRMKQLLDAGAIGELVQLNAGQLLGRFGGWLAEREHGGGPLYYVGSHVLDQVLWLAGRPAQRVYATVQRPGAEAVEQAVQWSIDFAGGLTAQVSTSQRLGCRYGWLDLFGTAGRMHAEWENHRLDIQSTVVPEYGDLTSLYLPPEAGLPGPAPGARASVPAGFYIRAWAAAMHEFAAAIAEGRPPAVTGEDAVHALSVIDAVWASEAAGGPVACS